MRRLTAEERAAPAPKSVRRARRERSQAATTECLRRMPKRRLAVLAAEEPETALTRHLREQRPRTRGECEGGMRPCPWVSCRYHLALDVDGTSIKRNFPDLEVAAMQETCALDIADRGGITLEEVGVIMNITRERIRQVEVSILASITDEMREHAPPDADASRVEHAAKSLENRLEKLREWHNGQRAAQRARKKETAE